MKYRWISRSVLNELYRISYYIYFLPYNILIILSIILLYVLHILYMRNVRCANLLLQVGNSSVGELIIFFVAAKKK